MLETWISTNSGETMKLKNNLCVMVYSSDQKQLDWSVCLVFVTDDSRGVNQLDDFMECLSKFTRYNSVRPLATLSYASDLYNGSSIVSRYYHNEHLVCLDCWFLSNCQGNSLWSRVFICRLGKINNAELAEMFFSFCLTDSLMLSI